jgi:predicted RNase H-like HicB family nuclease
MSEKVNIHNYVDLAIGQASLERLVDGTWCAEVPHLPGVLATGTTVDDCLDDLKHAIMGWIDVRRRRSLDIPAIDLKTAVVALA